MSSTLDIDPRGTVLPGIGSVHVLNLHDGHRVGVIRHHDDRRELVVYSSTDPDTRVTGALLTAAEARALAALVEADGPPVHCARLERLDAEWTVVQVMVGRSSPLLRRPLADLGVDGARVAAVVRDERLVLAAEPGLRCEAGDVIVAIARPEAAFALIDTFGAA